jgi:L-alanine-DL-glutamate epimerase-like enolase superfamily enzyme
MEIQTVDWFCFGEERRDGGGNQRHVAALRLNARQGAVGGAILHIRKPFEPRQLARADTVLKALAVDHPGDGWDRLHEAKLGLELLSLCDIALWDLWGRQQESCVHALLQTRRRRIPAYLSTPFNLGSPEQYAQNALEARQRGFHGYKIHPYITFTDVWGEQIGYPDKDLEAYEAVADAVGPGWALMTDNFCSYDLEQAIRVGRRVEQLGYLWYESPMMETNDRIEDYLTLKSELNLPICTTETTPGCHLERQAWLDRGACDIARIDPAYGGFTACVRLARACRQAGIKLEIHVGDAYSLQLMASCDEDVLKYYETFHLGTEARHKPGRLSPEPAVDDQGYVPVGDTPGMGVEIDWPWLEKRGKRD